MNYYEKGELVGISVDIVQAIQAELKSNHPIEIFPWARAFETLKRSRNALAFTAGKSLERIAAGFHFIGPITSRTHALYALSGHNPPISDIEELRSGKKKIGGVRSDWRTIFLEDNAVPVEKTGDQDINLKKLLSTRIDYWIASDLIVSHYLSQHYANAQDLFPAYVIARKPSYIMASPDISPDILENWNNAFQTLQNNGTLIKIADKWAKKTGLPFIYSPKMGVHILSTAQ